MEILKKNWVHFAALIIFLLSTFIYFSPALSGKKLQQSDILHWKGMAQESIEYNEKTGDNTLWTNSMFGGMPTYYINFKQTYTPIDYVKKGLQLGFKSEIGKFMMGLILFYLLLILLKVNPWLAISASLAFAFTTNNLVLLNAGHSTKVLTLMSSPLVIAGVLLAYRNKAILGTILFSLGMSINLKSQHPQMTYYLGIVMLIYVIIVFIDKLRKGHFAEFAKASGLLVIGLLLAIGTTADRTLPIYEYSKDTMRGKPILSSSKSNDSSSKVDGLAWDYAMSWSNGSIDLLSSFIPMAVGGSSSEKVDRNSSFAKEIRKRGGSTSNLYAPLYWGKLPGTSGPIYFGAVIFFLFFISLFTYKGNIKIWILAAVLLTFLLSLGKNLEWFNRLFFDLFPYYNKFRTPNSILSVTAVIIPLLAALGLQDLVRQKRLDFKKVLIPGAGFIVITALVGLLGPSILDLSSPGDIRLEQAGLSADVMIDDRASFLRSSALRSAALMLMTLAGLWGFFKGKLKAELLFIVVGLLAFGDLYLTNLRYVSSDKYVSERIYKSHFTPRKVDTQILSDTDIHYRVYDGSVDAFRSTVTSYYHKSIGGYHAAKLQRYQDMIEYHISKGNMNVLNMLNTKYIIGGQPGSETVNMNPAALGNAWFVNKVEIVNTADEEIEALTELDPLGTAIVHKEFASYLTDKTFNKDNSIITLKTYAPNKLTYQSNSTSDQFAVFSEIWYGPNKGWIATIDGKEVEHTRVNYVLRGLNIPSGQHEIVFEFKPKSNQIGIIISWVSTILLMFLIAFYFWNKSKSKKGELKS